jgi:nucleotide-binding universal stress UspA family protein
MAPGPGINEFVVGVDGSDHSRMALRWAAAVAGAAGVQVRAVQSWTHPRSAVLPIAPVPLAADEMDEQTQQALTAVVTDTLGSSAGVTTRVLRGSPAGRCSRRSPPTACSCWGRGVWAASPG